MAARHLLFAPFRLDPVNEELWREGERLAIRPKPFAVLRYLVERAGQLVLREELEKAVWPKVHVSEGVLRGYVRELRAVLGDDAEAPRFVETAPRRGYRFVAVVKAVNASIRSSGATDRDRAPEDAARQGPQSVSEIVGREKALERLRGRLESALTGERRVVFVTGEPGIGKTTLVDAFVAGLGGEGWAARGQCVESYGAGEPHLPMLEALGRLARGAQGERVLALLRQYAPSWLAQLPWLLTTEEREALQRQVSRTTRERMLREIAEMLEALTAEMPLVLVFEDLHWSDYSTVELIASLARRREAARVMIIGSYRPVEVAARSHPLKDMKQELQLHGQCEELELDFLRDTDVSRYLDARFSEGGFSAALARSIHRRTDGNPLFVVGVVDQLVRQGAIRHEGGRWQARGAIEAVEAGVPESLRQLIEHQFERLGAAEQRVLEVASVAGIEFSAAAVAAGAEGTVGVEEVCASLARRQHFLGARTDSEWPDGTVAAGYGFQHALYQEVTYERVTAERRIRLHRLIGERIERGYGERAKEAAAELAAHFEQGRRYSKALRYLEQAADNALRRSAHHEAVAHLTRALRLLENLDVSPERAKHELRLQLALAMPLSVTEGYASHEVEGTYLRARKLCEQVGDASQLFHVVHGLSTSIARRGEFHTAAGLAEDLLNLAQREEDPSLLFEAHHVLGQNLLFLGKYAAARTHFERGIDLYDSHKEAFHVHPFEEHPGVACHALAGWVLWFLGYPDQARRSTEEALDMARASSHFFSLAIALVLAAGIDGFARDPKAALEHAEEAIAVSREHGFPFSEAVGAFWRGYALTESGEKEQGLAEMTRGLGASGFRKADPHFSAILCEAFRGAGQIEEARGVLAGAVAAVVETGVRSYESELHRLKGELLLQSNVGNPSSRRGSRSRPALGGAQAAAEDCFQAAITVARRQSGKWFELRATMSLSRLWQAQGKTKQAGKILAEIYDWFTEGFDTVDLKEARALLQELGVRRQLG